LRQPSPRGMTGQSACAGRDLRVQGAVTGNLLWSQVMMLTAAGKVVLEITASWEAFIELPEQLRAVRTGYGPSGRAAPVG